jgi:hypothetical protein
MNPILYRRLIGGAGGGSGPSVDLCAVSAGVLGQIVDGDSFDCLGTGSWDADFTNGTGWGGPWSVTTAFISTVDTDTFDEYTPGSTIDGESTGSIWAGPWVASENFLRVVGFDDFSDYSVSAPPGNGGSEWPSGWVSL